MDVSVVVPCYDSERYLRRCLESLLNQSYPREAYEVIVVDNQSHDASAQIARGYPGVTVLHEPKRGSYAARNTGVKAASGRILAFTDSDCEVCEDWLERMVKALSDERTAVVLGASRFAREGLWLSAHADYEWEKALYVFAGDDQSLYYAYTNNMAAKREVYERCGPFTEIQRGADVVFMSRAVAAFSCSAVRFVPEMKVTHLEINRWHCWLEKMWTYGKSYAGYHCLSRTRPLGFRERTEILRRTVKHRHYSPARVAWLLLAAMAAGVAYEAGRLSTRLLARPGNR